MVMDINRAISNRSNIKYQEIKSMLCSLGSDKHNLGNSGFQGRASSTGSVVCDIHWTSSLGLFSLEEKMKKYNFPDIKLSIYAPDLKKAKEVAKEVEKGIHQLFNDWIEKSKILADKHGVKITEMNEKDYK